MPRPEIVSGSRSTTRHATATGTVTLTTPLEMLAGDYLLVATREQNPVVSDWAASNGLTRLGAAFVSADNTNRLVGLFGKHVANPEAEPLTFTMSSSGAGRSVFEVMVIRHVDNALPVAGFSAWGGASVTNGRSVPALTLTPDRPMLAIFVSGAEHTANLASTPTDAPIGWTPILETDSGGTVATSRSSLQLYTRSYDTTPTDAASITYAATPVAPHAQVIVLRGTSDTPDAGPGIPALSGDRQPVKAYVINDAGDPVTPTALIPMHRGFSSVDEVLDTPGFTMGHRGNSVQWPEMSMCAYTQSVRLGYGLLEVSLGRTSDGVFVGLHDDSINRTAGTTGLPNIGAMTWAQVQSHQNVLGAAGTPKPYMRLEEYIEAYGHSHVTMFDPKSIDLAGRTALYSMLAADVGVDRTIVKSYGDSSHIGDEARAAGFTSWGFFYAVNITGGQLAADQDSWDWLGMDYTASQSEWDAVLGYGKPVIAHVAPTQGAYDTAMSKGAVGVQCSASHVIKPVSWWTQGGA